MDTGQAVKMNFGRKKTRNYSDRK